MNTTISIDGEPFEEHHLLALRWAKTDSGSTPVLYKEGKHVVQKWTICLTHDEPEDAFGSSGNTT